MAVMMLLAARRELVGNASCQSVSQCEYGMRNTVRLALAIKAWVAASRLIVLGGGSGAGIGPASGTSVDTAVGGSVGAGRVAGAGPVSGTNADTAVGGSVGAGTGSGAGAIVIQADNKQATARHPTTDRSTVDLPSAVNHSRTSLCGQQ